MTFRSLAQASKIESIFFNPPQEGFLPQKNRMGIQEAPLMEEIVLGVTARMRIRMRIRSGKNRT